MGLLGGLLGGGTKVSNKNQTTVNTDVDIDLSNVIDLSGLEAIFDQLKAFFIADGKADADFKTMLLQQNAGEADLTKQQQTLLLLGTAIEADRNKKISEATGVFKIVAFGGLALGAYYLFNGKSK